MKTLNTTIHAYSFNTRNADELLEFEALQAELISEGLKCMESHGGIGHYHFVSDISGQPIELETNFIFDNQWNTAPVESRSDKGLRVFDWAQDACLPNRFIKRGHYLIQTDAMAEIRRNIHKCGYCGNHEPAAKGYTFCPKCLDSEYLSEDQLHLTRMMAAGVSFSGERAELSEAEKAHLMPLYVHAQTAATGSRAAARTAKQRADTVAELEKSTNEATTKHDGFIWLMDNGVYIDNCIYYSHTNKFCFGWKQPVSDAVKSALLDIISEFPFAYEIKCADGAHLESYND
jgi:hypothetical protein